MRREKNEIKEDLKLKAGQGGKQEKRVCAYHVFFATILP